MFGFTEPAHTVVESVTVPYDEKTSARLERRKPSHPGNDYLVIVPPEGSEHSCVYLMYEGEYGQNLEADWQLLLKDPDLDPEDLDCSEYVINDTGYGADGSVTMY